MKFVKVASKEKLQEKEKKHNKLIINQSYFAMPSQDYQLTNQPIKMECYGIFWKLLMQLNSGKYGFLFQEIFRWEDSEEQH